MPFAEREELHQLAGEVLVGLLLAVLVVVEVAQHGRVADDRVGQRLEVADRVRPEQLVLQEHVIAVLDRPVARGEVAVPEQRHLLLERPRRLDHLLQPPPLQFAHLPSIGPLRLLAPGAEALQGCLVTLLPGFAKRPPILG